MSSKIEAALKRKMQGMIPTQSFIGRVIEVNEGQHTCDVMPIDSEAEVFDVRLKPTPDDEKAGIIAIPDKDSFVIVGVLNNNENSSFVILASAVKKYLVQCVDGGFIEILDDGTVLINGDDYEGLVKVAENVDRLNKIEKAINDLKQVFSSWTPVTYDGGATLKSAVASWAAQMLVETQKSDIENDKVKHGKGI